MKKGEISFSHIREFQSPAYEIDKNDYDKILKLAKKQTFDVFKSFLVANYGKGGQEKQASGDQKADKVDVSRIKKVYIPFLTQKIEKLKESKDLKPLYTEADLQAARLDAIRSTMNDETDLAKAAKPFEEELKAKEEEEEKKKHGQSNYEKFIDKNAKTLKQLLDLPIDDETDARPYPTTQSALIKIASDIKTMKPEEFKELGFEIKLDECLKAIHEKFVENKKKAKEARDKKAKEKAEKEAADKAAGVVSEKKKPSKKGGKKEKTK